MDDKSLKKFYSSPEYKQLLEKYWNNGTINVQDPHPMIEEIRRSILKYENLNNTASTKDAYSYLEDIKPGNRA